MSFRCIGPLEGPKKGTILFLPGWGFRGDIIMLVEDLPTEVFYPLRPLWEIPLEEYILLLRAQRRSGCGAIFLMGWSMGATFALREIMPLVDGLIDKALFSSVRRSYPTQLIENMKEMLSKDKKRCLRYFYRECFKGQWSDYTKFRNCFENAYLEWFSEDELLQGLLFLEKNPVPRLESRGGIELVVIQGAKDAISPPEAMPEVSQDVKKVVLKDEGHLPFLRPGLLRTLVHVEKGY